MDRYKTYSHLFLLMGDPVPLTVALQLTTVCPINVFGLSLPRRVLSYITCIYRFGVIMLVLRMRILVSSSIYSGSRNHQHHVTFAHCVPSQVSGYLSVVLYLVAPITFAIYQQHDPGYYKSTCSTKFYNT